MTASLYQGRRKEKTDIRACMSEIQTNRRKCPKQILHGLSGKRKPFGAIPSEAKPGGEAQPRDPCVHRSTGISIFRLPAAFAPRRSDRQERPSLSRWFSVKHQKDRAFPLARHHTFLLRRSISAVMPFPSSHMRKNCFSMSVFMPWFSQSITWPKHSHL